MLLRAAVALILLYLLVPLLVIVLFAFHATPALSFPFQGASLRWFAEVGGDGQLLDAVLTSLLVAALTSLATLVLGATAALAWLQSGPLGRRAVELLTITPIALPGLFVGTSLLLLFAQAGLQLGVLTIVVAHVVVTLPIVMVAMRARIALFDLTLEEASRDLGATRAGTFRRVTLPMILPTLLSATILAFAASFDEFVVTAFVSGTETTLPMYIWSMMRRTVTPVINAVSTLALLFSLLALLAAALVGRARRNAAMTLRLGEDPP